MEHVVFYPGADAAPAFRRFASLEEAVRFVEHLRNVEGVAEVSVHALSEVPVAFRAYYRVEVPDAPPAPSGLAAVPVPAPPADAAEPGEPAEDADRGVPATADEPERLAVGFFTS